MRSFKGFILKKELIFLEIFSLLILSLLYFSFFEKRLENALFIVKSLLFIVSLFSIFSLFLVCEQLLFKIKLNPFRFGGSFLFHSGLFFSF